ncbi:hypothetical protein M407DRAFT_7409, partial [Tulasnella calospora MUT 4182]
KQLNRGDFEDLPEYEVEKVVDERWENLPARKGRKARRIKRYLTRFVGYGPEWDEWLTEQDLRNAPLVLQEWKDSGRTKKESRAVKEPGAENARREPKTETPPVIDQHKEDLSNKESAPKGFEDKEGGSGRQLRSRRERKLA